MSAVFQPLVGADGYIPVTGTAPGAGSIGFNGLTVDAAGALHVTAVGPIDHHHNGMPFDAAGSLCISTVAPTRFQQALGFESDRVCMEGTSPVVTHAINGVGYTANSAIAVK